MDSDNTRECSQDALMDDLSRAAMRFQDALSEWRDAGRHVSSVSIALHDFVAAIVRYESRQGERT